MANGKTFRCETCRQIIAFFKVTRSPLLKPVCSGSEIIQETDEPDRH